MDEPERGRTQVKDFLHQQLEPITNIKYTGIHVDQLQRAVDVWISKQPHSCTRPNIDVSRDFLKPTLELFQRLSEKKFPFKYTDDLGTNTYMVIHFVESITNSIQSGTAFFQIGNTTPGTLSLKFAKHRQGEVEPYLQNSCVDEDKLTDDGYLQRLRDSEPELGHTLFHSLILQLISSESNASYIIKKTEKVLSRMYTRTPNPQTSADGKKFDFKLNVILRTSFDEDQQHNFKGKGTSDLPFPEQASEDNAMPDGIVLRQKLAEEDEPISECEVSTSTPPLQASNNPFPSTENAGSFRVDENKVQNPKYPSTESAVKKDALVSADTLEKQTFEFATGDVNNQNPKYPSTETAVKKDGPIPRTPADGTTGDENKVHNLKYPATETAVQKDPGTVGNLAEGVGTDGEAATLFNGMPLPSSDGNQTEPKVVE